MSAGLVIKDTSGNIILDMTTRIPREIGSFSTGTSDNLVRALQHTLHYSQLLQKM